MEGLTIAILVIMLVLGVLFSRMNRQGSAALESVAGDFALTPERAAEIAAEAGLTSWERTQRKSVPVTRTAQGLRFEIECRAGVMAFEVHGLPGSSGSRIVSRAERVAIIRLPELGGLGASSTNVLYLKMGMPRNAAKLLRRRERVLRALWHAACGDHRNVGGDAHAGGRVDADEVGR
jgi:hypothetical protein